MHTAALIAAIQCTLSACRGADDDDATGDDSASVDSGTGRVTACLRGLVLAATLGACAPAYRPPAPFVPMLEEQGDVNIAAQVGVGGAQVDAAVATSKLVSLRGGAQVAGWASEGHYALGRVGAGVYGGNDAGTRWAVNGDVGAGLTRGVGDVTSRVQSTIPTPEEDTSTVTTVETTKILQNSGILLVASLRPQLGYEGSYAATALVLGFGYHQLFHDVASDGVGSAAGVTFEPTAVLRLGGGDARFGLQAWLGLALPLAGAGVENIPVPLNTGLGLTLDLSKRSP